MCPAPISRDPILSAREARAAVVVAHPDDETLWAGGFILERLEWDWTIVALCRQSDPDRAPKFYRVLERYNAHGGMRDMDDGPDQKPLPPAEVEREVLDVLPAAHYDLILTHGPFGEYTRHVRHEETGRAVSRLWKDGRLAANEVWMFAYEDGEKQHLPRAIEQADVKIDLPTDVWGEKYRIITETYGFAPDSWEAQTTPRVEAFWRLRRPSDIDRWDVEEERIG